MTSPARRAFALALLAVLLAPLASGAPATGAKARRPRPGPAAKRDATPPAPSVRLADYDSTRGDSIAEGRVYMAWHAPYGTPGATANLDLACADTTGEDTLYLSFETGRHLEGFYGVSARLRFLPGRGEALGPFWDFGRAGANAGAVRVQLDADGTFPCPLPWNRAGYGTLLYAYNPSAGDLRFIYAVPVGQTIPVSATTRYCFARLILGRRRCGLDGSAQPVCLEWAEALYSGGGKDIPLERGERFVGLNSPGGGVCAPYRSPLKVPTWAPKTPPVPPPDTTAWR